MGVILTSLTPLTDQEKSIHIKHSIKKGDSRSGFHESLNKDDLFTCCEVTMHIVIKIYLISFVLVFFFN